MKILIVADTFPPHVNGAALAAHRMALGLKKRGHEIYVIAPSTSLLNTWGQEDGMTVYRIRSVMLQKRQEFRVSPQLLVYHRGVRKIISIVNPDIIHVHNPGFLSNAVIPIAIKQGIPIVATCHFMPENLLHLLHLPHRPEEMLRRILWRRVAKFYNRLDAVISPTQTAANLLIKNKIKIKPTVISNGIDLEKYKRKFSKEEAKKKLKLPDKPIVLFVGRLDQEKHLHILIKAVAMIKDQCDFQVIIVGKGIELESLQDLSRKLGVTDKVTFTGYLSDEDLDTIYDACDIFAMPGIAELQSLVTMEAMATGTPIIAANAVALPHLVHDGENGFLFKPGDAVDLSKKLKIMLEDSKLLEKMGEKSMEIIKVHDVNHVLDEIEKVHKEAVEKHQKIRRHPENLSDEKSSETPADFVKKVEE